MKIFLLPLLAFIPLVSTAQTWEPKPWQKYVAQMEAEKDTVQQPSIMFNGRRQVKAIDPKATYTNKYYVCQPGIFEAEDERRAWEKVIIGEYNTGDFIVNMVTDILEGLFTK